ncbi:MAG: type II secretion system protein [Pseudonocardiaceae bacterium]|nr:type II secretion system protein [Pseudonocardiaceae bacterium]
MFAVADRRVRRTADSGGLRLLPIVFAIGVGSLPVALGGWPHGAALSAPVALSCWWVAKRRLGGRSAATDQPLDRLRLAAGWDLLAACLRAGLPVPAAIRAIAGEMPGDAAGGLRASAELLALGAEPERAWQPALAHPATAQLARSARRTARSGTALADVSTALAERVRAEINDAAEAKAQRAGVLITGPLGLCFLPAFLCLGVIPVIVGMTGRLAVPL